MKKYLTGITRWVFNPGPYTTVFFGLTFSANDTCKQSSIRMYVTIFQHPNIEHTCRMTFFTCSIIKIVFNRRAGDKAKKSRIAKNIHAFGSFNSCVELYGSTCCFSRFVRQWTDPFTREENERYATLKGRVIKKKNLDHFLDKTFLFSVILYSLFEMDIFIPKL